MTNSGSRRGWLVWVIAGGFVLAAAFFLDGGVQSWVMQHQTRFGIDFWRAVTRWGDWPSHVILGVLGVGLAWALASRQWIKIFAAMVLACALAGSVNRAIKMTAGRARPSVKVEAGWYGPSLKSRYHAFPSGHTAASTAFFAALCFARRKVGLALLPIPLLIAASRILLNAHYLSDVVFGAMLGIVCAAVVWHQVQRRSLAFAEPPAAA